LDKLVPIADLVHTHLPFNYPTYAAAQAAFRHRKPLFYHQRGVFDPARLSFRSAKKRLYLDLIEKPILRRATTLIALTEAERQSYSLLGIKTRCSIIPNGVDAALYSRRYDRREMLNFGIREQDLVVLFMGRIHPIKGADILLDAFAELRDRVPSAVLVLAGPDEFGLEDRFKQKASSAGLSGRVLFPGMVEGARKLNLLGRADLFCLPSAAEGFSMAVLEALASHTAVLLSPGCNFSDVVTARAGRICDCTVEAIKSGLEAMLADKDELRSMGDRGRALVESRFTWDSVVDQLLDVYQRGVEMERSLTVGASDR
jgi:glycosyltransferase involved in cell wall biosynthesis